MKITKIGYADGPNPTIHTTLQDLEPGRLTPIILVPDEQTLHEVKGLALILGRKVIVKLQEPGKELPWSSSMYSPWHVNTDKYTLTFTMSDTLQSPHLVYAPSYLTAYK
ncbi:hypothetical protein LD35_gp55 [Escherichia phage vB_EcoP_PhAPEC7]|uniref:Uncharacterized protein n=1 Tax=Escherichia phage vB_EcoP_PhAPEC7 TaxID=1391223 RepID=A0A067ZJN2_9CAUD|nr:hypothetical protein LD35_gp55 [Escherichia phage vB_EcoP_PhAPEC7]AHV82706.1 hypothetical protein PhAPEC7_82 [Escherichia phage vB_EcoP_PhAPEC7]